MNSLIPSVVAFGGGFFTALFAEPVRRWLYAPKLKLTFGTSQHFLTRTPEVSPAGQYESLWVRVKVWNRRATLARSCRAYLVNIERQATSGKFEATEYCESMQLAWSSQAEQSFSAFDLPRGVPHFVDIISTRPTSIAFQLAIRVTPLRYAQLVQTRGVYRFTVVVSGDGVKPATIRPVVRWTSTWDQIAKVDP
jgi:hypothetical protein